MSAASAPQIVPEDYDRAEMTDVVTRLLTAQVIVKPSFPKKETLPSLLPPAFANHGHLLNLDYRRMLEFVWQNIFNIQSAAKLWRRKRTIRLWLSLASCIAVYALLVFLSPINAGGAILLALLCYLGLHSLWVPKRPELATSIAEIRATAIRSLLDGTSDNAKIDAQIRAVVSTNCETGDGRLSDSRLPVLIVVNSDKPFPGYGRLQADATLVCPRKESAVQETLNLKSIDASVRKEIVRSIHESAIPLVSCGEVLVVDGWTIPPDHLFLEKRANGEAVPPLWCDQATADSLDSQPHGLSARKYFAIQILFPQFETTATLFTRPFCAGSSVAYQLAVVTLGAPVENGGHLRKQLAKHEMEKSGTNWTNFEKVDRILQLRANVGSQEIFQTQAVDYREISELKMSELETGAGFAQAADSIVNETARWPGTLGRQRNWREENSYAFTTRYFGRPEVVASFRSIYLQISKAILRSLDALDFDTAAYQDNKGHYSINVDKIDQMLISENMVVESKKDANQQPTTQATTTGANPQNGSTS